MNDEQETQTKVVQTTFGLPFLVSDAEYLFFCVLRNGVKFHVFPPATAISAEWNFMTKGWQPVD